MNKTRNKTRTKSRAEAADVFRQFAWHLAAKLAPTPDTDPLGPGGGRPR